jgi:hypothetical protein
MEEPAGELRDRQGKTTAPTVRVTAEDSATVLAGTPETWRLERRGRPMPMTFG